MGASCEPLQKLLSRSPLSRRLHGSATIVICIIMATRHYTMDHREAEERYRISSLPDAVLVWVFIFQSSRTLPRIEASARTINPTTHRLRTTVKNKKRNAIIEIYPISRMQTSEWNSPAARSPLPARPFFRSDCALALSHQKSSVRGSHGRE
jgi:hypothetical protein